MAEDFPGMDILRRGSQTPSVPPQSVPPGSQAPPSGDFPGMDILRRGAKERAQPKMFDAQTPTAALPGVEHNLEDPAWYDPMAAITLPAKIAAPLSALTVGPVLNWANRRAAPLVSKATPYVTQAVRDVAQSPFMQAVTRQLTHYLGPPLAHLGERVKGAGLEIQGWLAPASVSQDARQTAGMVRHRAAELALQTSLAERQLAASSKAVQYLPHSQRLALIDWIETGMDPQHWLAQFPGMQAVGTSLRGILDDRASRVQQLGNGALEHLIDDYFPHIWKDADPALLAQLKAQARRQYTQAPGQSTASYMQQLQSTSPLAGPQDFLKHRVITYLRDGIALGLKPISDNPVDLVLMKVREMDRYLMGQAVFKEMQSKNLTAQFALGTAPKDWVAINDQIAKNYQYQPSTASYIQDGAWYAPKDVARVINNYLSPGLADSPTYQLARRTANNMNAASLGLSAFHVTAEAFNAMMSQVALGLQQVSRGEVARGAANIGQGMLPTAGVRAFLRGSKVLEAAHEGTGGQQMAMIVDLLTKGGMRFETDRFFLNSAAGNFWQAMRHSPVSEPLRRIAQPIMESLVPRLKAGVAFDLAEDALRTLPATATQEHIRQVMARIVDTVDNRMGLLVYDNLFWHRTLKDLGLLSTRALGWNLGTMRELGGGAVDWTRQAFQAGAHGTPLQVNERMAYVMALPFIAALYGSVAHYLRTGEMPESAEDRFYPGPAGKKWSLPTYMNDVVRYADNPMRTVWGKANPLLHTTVDMLTNRDFMNLRIMHPEPEDSRLGGMLREVGQGFAHIAQQYEPFSLRNVAREWRQGDPGQAVADFFGLTQAKKLIQRTPEEAESFNAWMEYQERKKRLRQEGSR